MSKRKVLFIGSFQSKSATGHVGGQMFACNSLVSSSLSDELEWILIDTTAATNLKRSLLSRLYNAVKRLLRVFYHLLFSRVDVVMAFCSSGYSFLEKGSMIKIAKLLGKRTVLAPRSGFLIDDINNSSEFKNKVESILDKTDFVICQGTYWKEFFNTVTNVEMSKLRVINNWIDPSKYTHTTQSIHSPIRLLFLGWVERNKGIWDLLEVMQMLSEEEVELTIAGKGKEYDVFIAAVKERNLDHKIKFEGWVVGEDKYRLLEGSDIFILPSYREGLPNSLLEAMSSGKAVIVSDVGAVSDVVVSGSNGMLITPGDVEGMAKAIMHYVNNKQSISLYGKEAVKTILAKNSLEQVLPKFKEILL